MQFHTTTEIETKELAKKIAFDLKGGDIVLLEGELGAGKTTFTKGLAEGLGVKEEITSPTFTLMNVYEVKSLRSKVKSLVHVDTYRLKDAQDLTEIGIEDYLGDSDTICVIEWPEKIKSILKGKQNVEIKITSISKDERSVSLISQDAF